MSINDNITDNIKNIIFKFIKKEYENYLENNSILLIKNQNIDPIINNFYEENKTKLKNIIRSDLKDLYKENYPSASVENIILDIFQDRDFNIKKTINELLYIQDKNLCNLEIPIINDSLNLNISITNNYIIINSANPKNIKNIETTEIYEKISKYKFLYAIEDVILEEIDNKEKINTIKRLINNKNKINITLYYLKNN
tara:strand:- start:3001 stop:3594 length:594 start_codon:yes stop_codon:yes gene_type:complete